MGYLIVKNWHEFQHYKDRNPPWIKLHRTLLDDYEFACLQDASKLHLMLIWLLASQSEGRIPDDENFLKGKLGLKSPPNLQALISVGFLIPEQNASNALAPDASNLRLESETYKAAETDSKTLFADANGSWSAFWSEYPRKTGKKKALISWKRVRADDIPRIMQALAEQKNSDQWRRGIIPHPATWLNGGRWEDELPAADDFRKDVL